jgi:hypothetical protein
MKHVDPNGKGRSIEELPSSNPVWEKCVLMFDISSTIFPGKCREGIPFKLSCISFQLHYALFILQR